MSIIKHQYCSSKTIPTEIHLEPIHVITQFYLPTNAKRKLEIQKCLELMNINKYIDTIYLLNERIYTNQELGIQSNKIKQINIKRRLLYSDCFDYIDKLNIKGYIIITNSDIFFDGNLINIKWSNLHNTPKVFCQLRIEYDEINPLSKCKLFGPCSNSQDVWIFHSHYNIQKKYRKIFEFHMGKPGCDNKLVYLWNILGYQCNNEPEFIKCYHYHNTNFRTYSNKDMLSPPFCSIVPNIKITKSIYPHSFCWRNENKSLIDFIQTNMKSNTHFIIPRLAGVENDTAHMGVLISKKELKDQQQRMSSLIPTMKNNAGIHLTNLSSVIKYSQMYLEAFEKCNTYFDWPSDGNVALHYEKSFQFIYSNFNKPRIASNALDIYCHIHHNPWTLQLKGKCILIISAFIESIQEKINIREKIYGIDLFPECTFIFLKPPQTQGKNPSRDFQIEFSEFCKKIEAVKDQFDIALCSCGGYGNLVCSYIFTLNKSAIYVGGVLQMYFGIYGQRWIRETSDIMKLYMNQYWTKPKDNEKPTGYKQIEQSCYW